jgi:hypothetical protein
MQREETRHAYQHADGRLCRWLAYSLDHNSDSPSGQLLRAWFYGLPPDMRRCDRDHDPKGALE